MPTAEEIERAQETECAYSRLTGYWPRGTDEERGEKCPECDGNGYYSMANGLEPDLSAPCGVCGGSGKEPVVAIIFEALSVCPECRCHRAGDDRVRAGMKCAYCAY